MRRKPIQGEATLLPSRDLDNKVSRLAPSLDRINKVVPWEDFRPVLSRVRKDSPKGGRPAYDEVFMFKCLIIGSIYGFSDEELELYILDRLVFRRFLGMNEFSSVPNYRTIWTFRESLKKHGLADELFDRFNACLEQSGVIVNKGYIVDSTIAECPRQRGNQRRQSETSEKERESESCQDASDGAKNPRSTASQNHKDSDARWTKKHGRSFFGYKDHVVCDGDSKLILSYRVTPANMHDSQPLLNMLSAKTTESQRIYGDSAYYSQEIIRELKDRGYVPCICEKGYRNKALSSEQIKSNVLKSKYRCRIEHIFGDIKSRYGKYMIRSVGLARASVRIALINLAYNMRRFAFLRAAKASI